MLILDVKLVGADYSVWRTRLFHCAPHCGSVGVVRLLRRRHSYLGPARYNGPHTQDSQDLFVSYASGPAFTFDL